MARKSRIIGILVVGIAIVTAIVTRFSLTQRDADIYTRKGKFYGVFDSEMMNFLTEKEIKKELNKIAARWPAKAMVQFFLFLQK